MAFIGPIGMIPAGSVNFMTTTGDVASLVVIIVLMIRPYRDASVWIEIGYQASRA